ncbi:MAG: diacylglycerol kinase family lipid kinase [Bacteroidales bacterium]|nr:diacylglycerol kinase family lipid kinase [Bacteroidales bacterium]
MNEERKWVFIINPIAGNGFALTLAEELKNKIQKHNVDADMVFTERKGHATELSEKYAAMGYSYIIGVGGDGTFNEIASPLINNRNITTGLISGGTGNDFIQILGFPDRFEEQHWGIFFEKNVIQMDVGKCNGMLFFNGMGLGFDAQVAAENYTEPGEVKRGGKNKYIWHILKTLLFFKEKKMTVLSEGKKSETDCFINTIANGRRFAGGFLLTPKAVANDGLLDVCSIKRLSLPQRLKILLMVPKGTHINDKKVNYYQTNKLSLEFPGEVPFHLDGELYFSQHFEVGIMPGALNIIYNPSGPHYFSKTD